MSPKSAAIESAVINAMKALGACTIAQVAAAVGPSASRAAVGDALKRLVRRGVAFRPRRAVYRLL